MAVIVRVPLSGLTPWGSKAAAKVIVNHADSLHKGVADGGADESESPPLQITGHCLRFRCLSRHVLKGDHSGSPKRFVVGELPDVAVEASELFLNLQEALGVVDYGIYLQPVAHDTSIGQQSLPISCSVSCHLHHIEVIECPPKVVPLP